MKILINAVVAAFIAAISMDSHSVSIKPRFVNVDLEEFTTLELKVLPHAGTQLVFPFLLDNPELKPALKMSLSSDNGFDVPTDPEQIESLVYGQNLSLIHI